MLRIVFLNSEVSAIALRVDKFWRRGSWRRVAWQELKGGVNGPLLHTTLVCNGNVHWLAAELRDLFYKLS